jgi:hypothetical protein
MKQAQNESLSSSWLIFTFWKTKTMDKGTALTLLGLDGDAAHEEVMERLDAETFSVRDHFMRQPIVPSLFRSRVNRLVQLSDVSQALTIAPLGATVDLPELLPAGENLLLLVRNHIENIRRLRTEMAATLDPDVLAHFGNAMTNLQLRYMEGFVTKTEDWMGDETWPDPIPAREESDWQKVLDAIGAGPTAEDAIVYERSRIQRMVAREMS